MSTNPEEPNNLATNEIEFSLDDFKMPEAAPSKAVEEAIENPGTLKLDLFEDDAKGLVELSEELKSKTPNTLITSIDDLELSPAIEVLDLIDSNERPATKSGEWELDKISAGLSETMASDSPATEQKAKPLAELSPEPANKEIITSANEAETIPVAPTATLSAKDLPTQAVAVERSRTEKKSPRKRVYVTEEPPKAANVAGRETLLLILLGVMLLGVVNWLYFSNKSGPETETSGESASVLEARRIMQREKMAKKLNEDTTPAFPMSDYEYTISDSKKSLKAFISTDFEKVSKLSVEIETTAPPPQSAEDIVLNRPAEIWVKKVEITALTFTFDETGQFTGKGSAKVYIEQANDRERFIAPVTLTVIPETDKNTMNASLEIGNHFSDKEKISEELIVDKFEAGKFRIYLNTQLKFDIKSADISAQESSGDLPKE